MSELGQMLRDARTSRGISLAEAEQATRIRRKYLQALEDADYDALPPGVYVRGFIRSYATYLGLDPEETLATYHDGVQSQPVEPQIISEPLTPGSPINWELVGGVLMLVVLGVVLVLVYRTYIVPLAGTGSEDVPPAVSDALIADTETPAAALADDATETPTATPSATLPPPTTAPPTLTATRTPRPTVTPAPQQVRPGELILDLRATARSWVRVVADGETVFTGTLVDDEERTWKAERQIELRTGNAGGLIAFINGREIGALGSSGEVLDYRWRLSDDGGIVMGTPAPSP